MQRGGTKADPNEAMVGATSVRTVGASTVVVGGVEVLEAVVEEVAEVE